MATATISVSAQQRAPPDGSRLAPIYRMRTAVVILIMAGLGCFFIIQKRHEHEAAAAKPVAAQSASPRPISEHNWAKHALDRTKEVTSQVAQQRKEEGVRK